jgi:VanZ family protein
MDLSHRRKITIILLVFYWPARFILAHIPVPQLVREAGVSDKSLHLFAYLILSFLLWFAVSGDKKVSWRRGSVWLVLFVIIVYGIFDEWLQGYVPGRSCDVRDFIADVAGTLTGLILFSFFTFWPAGLLVVGTIIFGITNIARANLVDLMPITNGIFNIFGYAIFTLLWVQYMLNLRLYFSRTMENGHLFSPTKSTKLKWLITALAAPTVLLFSVKLFSVILGKGFAVRDMLISLGAIASAVGAIYMTALSRKTQD